MSRHLKTKFIIPCSLIAILTGPLGAVAATVEQTDDVPTRVVKFGDLDLNRSEGAAALYARISAAAREVCPPSRVWALRLHAESNECRHRAIAKAISDVGSSTLTKYYQEKTNFGIRESQQR
jgi:UrcA family protein